jgi:hypothetical protein
LNSNNSSELMHAITSKIAEQIGPDISYVRRAHQQPDRKMYLTGIDVGLLVASGIFASFLVGVAKGMAETLGKEIGRDTTSSVIQRLNTVRKRIAALLTTDSTDSASARHSIERDLYQIRSELIRSGGSALKIESFTEEQVIEVEEELREYGFTERKIVAHRTRLVQTIQSIWEEKQ